MYFAAFKRMALDIKGDPFFGNILPKIACEVLYPFIQRLFHTAWQPF